MVGAFAFLASDTSSMFSFSSVTYQPPLVASHVFDTVSLFFLLNVRNVVKTKYMTPVGLIRLIYGWLLSSLFIGT